MRQSLKELAYDLNAKAFAVEGLSKREELTTDNLFHLEKHGKKLASISAKLVKIARESKDETSK